jgi:hypothetical protein
VRVFLYARVNNLSAAEEVGNIDASLTVVTGGRLIDCINIDLVIRAMIDFLLVLYLVAIFTKSYVVYELFEMYVLEGGIYRKKLHGQQRNSQFHWKVRCGLLTCVH